MSSEIQLVKVSSDNNNNPFSHSSTTINRIRSKRYVERRLKILDKQFLIFPNGGSGDCMFKAVSQAIYKGDEQKHTEIRARIIEFIVTERWDKFKDSIEIQHITGNQDLLSYWNSNPVKAYKEYMKSLGTLGSSSELNAAGELFKYNFVTIQEYTVPNEDKSYRIENCCHYIGQDIPMYFFFFTGDFDNGHWEYLQPLDEPTNKKVISLRKPQFLTDGIYPGLIEILIDGVAGSIDNWLKVHTENTNDVFRLKHSTIRSPVRESMYPFEWESFEFEEDGSVFLLGDYYKISKTTHTDLFTTLGTVLFEDLNDETIIDRLEEQLLDYRVDNFSNLNHKLITQPFSHGFNLLNLKYVSMPCKGNIQDLLSAADLYGFSFQIFIKPARNYTLQSCKFVHVDRWGGETDKVEYFLMRLLSSNEQTDEVIAKWWHLTPTNPSNEDSEDQKDINCNIGDFSEGNRGESELKADERESPIETSKQQADSTRFKPSNRNMSKVVRSSSRSLDHNGRRTRESLARRKSSAKDSSVEDKLDVGQSDPYSQECTRQKYRSKKKLLNNKDNLQQNGELEETVIFSECAQGEDIQNSSTYRTNGSDGQQKLKTIVEMYDEQSKTRKKYVCEGYLPREKVLDALYEQGYIKKSLKSEHSGSNPETYEDEFSVISKKDLFKIKKSQSDFENKRDTDKENNVKKSLENIFTKKSKDQVMNDIEILEDQNIFKLRDETVDTPSDYVIQITKDKTASLVALVGKESIERGNKFVRLHNRCAPPKLKQPKLRQQGCFQRFLSWAGSPFRK